MVYRLLAFITIKRKLNNYFFKWHNIFNILVASAPHKSVINNHKKAYSTGANSCLLLN